MSPQCKNALTTRSKSLPPISQLSPRNLRSLSMDSLVSSPPQLQLHPPPLWCPVRPPDLRGRIRYPSPQPTSYRLYSTGPIHDRARPPRLLLLFIKTPPFTEHQPSATRKSTHHKCKWCNLDILTALATDNKPPVTPRQVQMLRTNCSPMDSSRSCLPKERPRSGWSSCNRICQRRRFP